MLLLPAVIAIASMAHFDQPGAVALAELVIAAPCVALAVFLWAMFALQFRRLHR